MIQRHACLMDLDALASLENTCFPAEKACSYKQMEERLRTFPEYFQILEDQGKILSFTDGMVTKETDLTDEMYENAALHTDKGRWLMILGVNTDPACRRKGYAGKCLEAAVEQAERNNLNGVVLTCKQELVPFYEKHGFRCEGLSRSVHGNVQWIQMRLIIGQGTITTEHLILERPQEKDAEDLYENLLCCRQAARYMDWTVADTIEDAEQWLQDYIKAGRRRNHQAWIVHEKGGGQAVGFSGFRYNGSRIYEEEGIAFGPDWMHRGYGGEVLDAFLHLCFEEYKGTGFIYGTLSGNTASVHLAESRGFRLLKKNTLHFDKDGQDHPHYVFLLSRHL